MQAFIRLSFLILKFHSLLNLLLKSHIIQMIRSISPWLLKLRNHEFLLWIPCVEWCKRIFKRECRKERLSHEDIYLFKRFPLQSNANKMHKSHLGKLAFQSDFCAFCLCRISGKTFWPSKYLRAIPPLPFFCAMNCKMAKLKSRVILHPWMQKAIL